MNTTAPATPPRAASRPARTRRAGEAGGARRAPGAARAEGTPWTAVQIALACTWAPTRAALIGGVTSWKLAAGRRPRRCGVVPSGAQRLHHIGEGAVSCQAAAEVIARPRPTGRGPAARRPTERRPPPPRGPVSAAWREVLAATPAFAAGVVVPAEDVRRRLVCLGRDEHDVPPDRVESASSWARRGLGELHVVDDRPRAGGPGGRRRRVQAPGELPARRPNSPRRSQPPPRRPCLSPAASKRAGGCRARGRRAPGEGRHAAEGDARRTAARASEAGLGAAERSRRPPRAREEGGRAETTRAACKVAHDDGAAGHLRNAPSQRLDEPTVPHRRHAVGAAGAEPAVAVRSPPPRGACASWSRLRRGRRQAGRPPPGQGDLGHPATPRAGRGTPPQKVGLRCATGIERSSASLPARRR